MRTPLLHNCIFRIVLGLLIGSWGTGALVQAAPKKIPEPLPIKVKALLETCSSKERKKFAENMYNLHLEYIRKYGHLTSEQFRSLPQEEQEIGEIVFPQSLPKGAKQGLPLDSFAVCAADQVDLMKALQKSSDKAAEIDQIKELTQDFISCMKQNFQFDSKLKDKLISCYEKLSP